MSEENDQIISVQGLTTRFGDHVVHEDLDLEVRRGEILAIIGGSGSGKSVLVNAILGLFEPHSGTIEIFGKEMSNASDRLAVDRLAAGALDPAPAGGQVVEGRRALRVLLRCDLRQRCGVQRRQTASSSAPPGSCCALQPAGCVHSGIYPAFTSAHIGHTGRIVCWYNKQAVERVYAPGGLGFAAARASFCAHS